MTATMQPLTRKIAKNAPVRFVSISVDPIRDTPEKLRGYARNAQRSAVDVPDRRSEDDRDCR